MADMKISSVVGAVVLSTVSAVTPAQASADPGLEETWSWIDKKLERFGSGEQEDDALRYIYSVNSAMEECEIELVVVRKERWVKDDRLAVSRRDKVSVSIPHIESVEKPDEDAREMGGRFAQSVTIRTTDRNIYIQTEENHTDNDIFDEEEQYSSGFYELYLGEGAVNGLASRIQNALLHLRDLKSASCSVEEPF